MAEVDDAFKLSTGTTQENAYAEYANYMKSLANKARIEMVNTKDMKYSPSAKTAYEQEVKSLDAKLNLAILNKPRERRAQAIANSMVAAKKKANPDMKKSELKKVKNQALNDARARVGARRQPIPVTSKEWEAIQAGAISANKLSEIMQYMDPDLLKQYATPRDGLAISEAKQNKIKAMAASGYTPDQIAEAVGVSTTTVHKYS